MRLAVVVTLPLLACGSEKPGDGIGDAGPEYLGTEYALSYTGPVCWWADVLRMPSAPDAPAVFARKTWRDGQGWEESWTTMAETSWSPVPGGFRIEAFDTWEVALADPPTIAVRIGAFDVVPVGGFVAMMPATLEDGFECDVTVYGTPCNGPCPIPPH